MSNTSPATVEKVARALHEARIDPAGAAYDPRLAIVGTCEDLARAALTATDGYARLYMHACHHLATARQDYRAMRDERDEWRNTARAAIATLNQHRAEGEGS